MAFGARPRWMLRLPLSAPCRLHKAIGIARHDARHRRRSMESPIHNWADEGGLDQRDEPCRKVFSGLIEAMSQEALDLARDCRH